MLSNTQNNLEYFQSNKISNFLELTEACDFNDKKIPKLNPKLPKRESKYIYHKIKSQYKNDNWEQQEDLTLVSACINKSEINWVEISRGIQERSAENCKQRWEELNRLYNSKNSWSNQDQIKLYNLLVKYAFNWKIISKEFPNRSSNSIKGFVHAAFRKIKKMTKIFWCLSKFSKWPTFTNKSKRV